MRHPKALRRGTLLLALLSLPLLPSCSTNPATGKSQLALVSEAQVTRSIPAANAFGS